MHCSVIEHGMTSLSFQTAVQKNEAKPRMSEALAAGNTKIEKDSFNCF